MTNQLIYEFPYQCTHFNKVKINHNITGHMNSSLLFRSLTRPPLLAPHFTTTGTVLYSSGTYRTTPPVISMPCRLGEKSEVPPNPHRKPFVCKVEERKGTSTSSPCLAVIEGREEKKGETSKEEPQEKKNTMRMSVACGAPAHGRKGAFHLSPT